MIHKIIGLFLFCSATSLSQSIEFIEVFQQKAKYGVELNHLNTLSDTTNLEYMGKVKVSYARSKIEIQKLFDVFKKVVDKVTGANFYSEYSYAKTDSVISVCFNLYYCKDLQFIYKNALANANKVYVFGDLASPNMAHCKVNDFKTDIPFGTYHVTDLKKESKLKLNKGSLTGETRTYRWKKEIPSRFLTFSDFGLSLTPIIPGLSINTGRFYEIDQKYGLFLVSLFKQTNTN